MTGAAMGLVGAPEGPTLRREATRGTLLSLHPVKGARRPG